MPCFDHYHGFKSPGMEPVVWSASAPVNSLSPFSCIHRASKSLLYFTSISWVDLRLKEFFFMFKFIATQTSFTIFVSQGRIQCITRAGGWVVLIFRCYKSVCNLKQNWIKNLRPVFTLVIFVSTRKFWYHF